MSFFASRHSKSARILLIGFGAVGQGLTSLLIKKLNLDPSRITAWAADLKGAHVAKDLNIELVYKPLTPNNYQHLLSAHLGPSDFLLNLAVEVSSRDLIAWCQQHDVFYLDTSIEPWPGGYSFKGDDHPTTNKWLRDQVLELRKPQKTTAVIAHGANPGLISHFAKQALVELAQVQKIAIHQVDWPELAQRLGIQVIQIAEQDTQTTTHQIRLGEFHNTWSIPGFICELSQYCEAGWGSHEPHLPRGTQTFKKNIQASITWPHPVNGLTQVKSWVPSSKQGSAWLITHNESISLAEFLSIHNSAGQLIYRPTVYFAYQPCPLAQESIQLWIKNKKQMPSIQNVPAPEHLSDGYEELGALLCQEKGAFWYGSTLTIHEARALVPHNNATTLQVAAGIIGALEWMHQNPKAGITEAEAMDSTQVLAAAHPYLGTVTGTYTNWRPGNSLSFDSFHIQTTT
jgi:homospermidine synthase